MLELGDISAAEILQGRSNNRESGQSRLKLGRRSLGVRRFNIDRDRTSLHRGRLGRPAQLRLELIAHLAVLEHTADPPRDARCRDGNLVQLVRQSAVI